MLSSIYILSFGSFSFNFRESARTSQIPNKDGVITVIRFIRWSDHEKTKYIKERNGKSPETLSLRP